MTSKYDERQLQLFYKLKNTVEKYAIESMDIDITDGEGEIHIVLTSKGDSIKTAIQRYHEDNPY